MFENNFYTIANTNDSNTVVSVVFNSSHKIYEGHFKNFPITPGVVLIQIIKEVLEKQIKNNLVLEKINNVKFLKMIQPQIENNFELCITHQRIDNKIKVNAEFKKNELCYLKFSGLFGCIIN